MPDKVGMTRVRGWTLYALAWVPVAAAYARLIGAERNVSGWDAVYAGLNYAVPAALLGVIVWWLTGRVRWPLQRPSVFFLLQILFAAAYSATWLVVIWLSIATATGFGRSVEIIRLFAGWQLLTGVWTYGITAGIAYAIRVSRALREKEAARARAEVARANAELSALKGQLNPHFLFNTLHTVMALVRRDPHLAESALEQFSEMLRYVLDTNRAEYEDVALAEELEFVHNFLALEQLRLGDRLRVVENVNPEALDCVIPSLTLQPLVENAVKYAVAPRVAGGTINITAALKGSSLVLEVVDDGPGMAASEAEGTGVGLRAVRQRLETRFPGESSFDAISSSSGGFAVRLSLPARTGARRSVPMTTWAQALVEREAAEAEV